MYSLNPNNGMMNSVFYIENRYENYDIVENFFLPPNLLFL